MLFCKSTFDLNKYNKKEVCSLPTVEQLRASLDASLGSDARMHLNMLFDKDTFVETGAYTKRAVSDFISVDEAGELEGVITGYGAIDGKLTFAFCEDITRAKGVIDERHAKKIADLYDLAIKSGAAVVGIFNSNGTDIFEGTAALAAYGRIINSVSRASGAIPQIAYVAGKCIGLSAAIAAMFDIIVKENSASFYVSSPALTGVDGAQDAVLAYSGDGVQCASYIRSLISYLPDNNASGIVMSASADNLNRKLGDLDFSGEGLSAVSVIADNAVYYEISSEFAPEVSTVLTTVGGVKCGIVASSFSKNEGRISVACARKISKFVNFCDAFNLPIITLADSYGLSVDKANEVQYFAPELAKLAYAYSGATVPKITVILGHAIGAAFVLLGSKSLGADLVYATSDSEIGALTASSGVAFAWNDLITLDKSREDLVNEWKNTVSTPAIAAASGEIDDIISVNELRARICSALMMLATKGKVKPTCCKVLPL